jgi:two-component system nitrate/nitrite response regulator NarL
MQSDVCCLIVEDHPITLIGYKALLESFSRGWKILGAENLFDASHCIASQPVDIVLLDLSLPDNGAIKFLSSLKQCASERQTKCITISDHLDTETIRLCKSLGASGHISKNESLNALVKALLAVTAGEEYFYFAAEKECPLLSNNIRLTARQKDLLDLVLNGYSNKQIAQALGLSYGTIKNYMFDLMRIFAVNSRLEMAVKARESGYKPHVERSIGRNRAGTSSPVNSNGFPSIKLRQ